MAIDFQKDIFSFPNWRPVPGPSSSQMSALFQPLPAEPSHWRDHRASVFLTNVGVGDGMAVTCLEYLLDPNRPVSGQDPINLSDVQAIDDIVIATLRQLFPTVVLDKDSAVQTGAVGLTSTTPAIPDLVNTLNGNLNGFTLVVRKEFATTGVTLVPFKIEPNPLGGGPWTISVYDPDDPANIHQVIIEPTGHWRYTFASGEIWGSNIPNAPVGAIGAVAVASYASNPVHPSTVGELSVSETHAFSAAPERFVEHEIGDMTEIDLRQEDKTLPPVQVFLEGQGHLLISGDKGDEQIGFRDGKFVRNIPGAIPIIFDGGRVETPLEPIYVLPDDIKEYNMHIYSRSDGVPHEVRLSQLGPAYAVILSGILVQAGRTEEGESVSIATNGSSLIYRARNQQAITAIFARASRSGRVDIEVRNLTLVPGDEVPITVDESRDVFQISSPRSRSTRYDLTISRRAGSRVDIFVKQAIELDGNSRHELLFGKWDGKGGLLQQVFWDDGRIEDRELDNEYSGEDNPSA